jgi:hypothetical protein
MGAATRALGALNRRSGTVRYSPQCSLIWANYPSFASFFEIGFVVVLDVASSSLVTHPKVDAGQRPWSRNGTGPFGSRVAGLGRFGAALPAWALVRPRRQSPPAGDDAGLTRLLIRLATRC